MEHFKHYEGANLENILKAAELIETIPQEEFDMRTCRAGQKYTDKCDSVGCIVGHCTVLAPELISRDIGGEIDFCNFTLAFFGFNWPSDDWLYLFAPSWIDTDNTPKGSAQRMRYYVANGLPINAIDQKNGKAPLSYNNNKIKIIWKQIKQLKLR